MSHTEESLFAEALEKRDPQERAEFLDQVCEDDAGLRASVESLLSATKKARGSPSGYPTGIPQNQGSLRRRPIAARTIARSQRSNL